MVWNMDLRRLHQTQEDKLGFSSKVHLRSYKEHWACGVTLKMSEENGGEAGQQLQVGKKWKDTEW